MPIHHATVSTGAQSADPSKMSKNEWNADHVFPAGDSETPSGTINGTTGADGNAVFTLANAPNPALGLKLVLNGLIRFQGDDYTLSGTTITYLAGSIPRTGDKHRAWYRY